MVVPASLLTKFPALSITKINFPLKPKKNITANASEIHGQNLWVLAKGQKARSYEERKKKKTQHTQEKQIYSKVCKNK